MENKAKKIVQKLQNAGYKAYWAGGCVRDILLGINPKDYDIVTNAKPSDIENIFPKTFSIGKHFGVVLAVEKNSKFEIATFRSEAEYKDARHPSKVFFTNARDDAQRRDFTINGIFYNPINKKYIDYVGGISDLKNRVIKFIGNPHDRINEDYLRLLRAVRFRNKFNFNYDKRTWEAICKNAYKIEKVSKERVSQELNKILIDQNRVKAIDDLSENGLLKYIIPELENTKNIPQPNKFHKEGDVYIHTLESLKSLSGETPLFLILAVLFHDIGKVATLKFSNDRIRFDKHAKYSAGLASNILRRLKYPNTEREMIVWLVKNHMKIADITKMKIARRRKFMMDYRFPWLLKLFKADIDGTKPKNYGLYNRNLELYQEAMNYYKYEESKPKYVPLLTGSDLMKKFNLSQGPKIGQMLKHLESAQLEGKINNKKAAFLYAARLLD
jgi:poly(A) polymerase